MNTTGAQSPTIFPAISVVEGAEVMMTLYHDLMLGKDVLPLMRKAKERLEQIL